MHYDVDYSKVRAGKRRERAINDIEQYCPGLSATMYYAATMCNTYSQFAFMCSFAGVQGYPVIAVWDQVKDDCRSMTE